MSAKMSQRDDVGRALTPDDGAAGRALKREELGRASPTIYIFARGLAPVIDLRTGYQKLWTVLVLLDPLRLCKPVLHNTLGDALFCEEASPHHGFHHVGPLFEDAGDMVERANFS